MKQLFANLCLGLAIVSVVAASCRKEYHYPTPPHTNPQRTIRYTLFTTQNFADDNDTITFTLRMFSKRTRFLDSTLKPMRISEIPDKVHSLVFDRQVPAGLENDTLQVGFLYEIKDVGVSGFVDTCAPGQTLKRVEFDFK